MLSGSSNTLMPRDKRCIVVGPVLLLLVVVIWLLGLTDHSVFHAHKFGDADKVASWPQTVAEDNGFTIIAPTFKRLDTLPKFVKHYASGNITSLRRIVILWFDNQHKISPLLQREFDSYPVPVVVEERTDSLNERFRRTGNVKTDCILSVDDDMIFAPEDIEFGYQTWRDFGQGYRRMVGYISREAGEDGSYRLGHLKSYSMILTKSAFYHTRWMDVYWSEDKTMTALREYVDKYNNCEDILMAFVTSRYTRSAPILIKAPLQDIGTKSGISSNSGHHAARNACIRHFKEVLGSDTLVSTSLLVKNMQSKNGEDTGQDW